MAPSSARSSSSGCRSPSARSGRAGRFCSVWPSSAWCGFFAAESSKHGPDTGRGVMPLVRAERLTKAFGALVAVNAVTFAVDEGSLHSVIGPNGAGKTTLFNLLSGQLAPTSGRSVFHGRVIDGTPTHCLERLRDASSLQLMQIITHLSILDTGWLATRAL